MQNTVHRLYAALAAGDVSAAAAVLRPDAVVHVPGTHPLTGDHAGIPAILEFLAATRSRSDAGERIEVLDVLEGRDHVAVYCRVRAERGPATLDNATVHLLRLEDDRVAEVWFHNREQAPVDAFWSGR